jgi:hypothetical protein
MVKRSGSGTGHHVPRGDGKQGTGGGGRPVPIPPNNGVNPAGWPSTTGKSSGGGRNNAPANG